MLNAGDARNEGQGVDIMLLYYETIYRICMIRRRADGGGSHGQDNSYCRLYVGRLWWSGSRRSVGRAGGAGGRC